MSLLEEQIGYKPFRYPWAYDAWLQQQRLHWLPEEVPMYEDVHDWSKRLDDNERNLLTQIFRFFTQADVEVNNCYLRYYSQIFKPTEVLMMLSTFSSMETIHIAAYAHLLDTLGMPETEYQMFMQYKEMKDKYDYMQQWGVEDTDGILRTMAVFGAFTEGLQLFASFAMLLNFPRFGKMKGMGQIIAWSVRDESLHTASVIKLYHTFLAENPQIDRTKLHADLLEACQTIVSHEDAFIDLAFSTGPVRGLTATEMKQYIRYMADRRLVQLGIKPYYEIQEQPLPWLDALLNGVEHANFFETRATEYSKAATRGTWEEAFSSLVAGESKPELTMPFRKMARDWATEYDKRASERLGPSNGV